MKIPCKECLCIPICRHKSYHLLVDGCEPAANYLSLSEDDIVNREDGEITEEQLRRIQNVEDILTPTRWRLFEK